MENDSCSLCIYQAALYYILIFSVIHGQKNENPRYNHKFILTIWTPTPQRFFFFTLMVLFLYLDALNNWLPRVTVGVPSPIIVVKFISFSRIRSSSMTT